MRWLALVYFVAVVVSAPVTLWFVAFGVKAVFYDISRVMAGISAICFVVTVSSFGFLLDRQADQIRKLKERQHD